MINQIIGFISPLVYLLSFTASLVYLTRRSFGKCLPITMMLSAFLLFFSQLIFGTFDAGFIIGILFAVASIGIGIFKRKDWEVFSRLYFTSGLVIFLTIYVLVFIYDFARGFSAWDEFSHWGMMLKEMLRLDKFYSAEVSNLLVHKDYPPIMQLFELFWIKLGGGYREALAERAMHTFELSLFIPFIAEKIAERKNILKSILVGVAAMFMMVFAMVLFDQHGVFQTIYTDYVMAIIVVFLLMTILTSKKISWFDFFTVMVGGGFLLLLKQMGLPLYLMVICFLIGIIWIRKNATWKEYLKNVGIRKTILTLLCLVLPFVVWMIWGRLVTDTVQQFDISKISFSDFVNVLLGRGEEWQNLTVRKYIMALGQENISTSFLQISYLQSIMAFIGLLWLVWWIFKKNLIKKEIYWLGVIVCFGAVGYAVAMMILYVLAFDSYEGSTLASFNRYMGTYSMMMIILVVMISIWQAVELKKRNIIYMGAIILALVNAPSAYSKIYPYIFSNNVREYEQAVSVTEEIVSNVTENKVFVVSQDSSLRSGFYLQYYLTPIKISYGMGTWPTGEEIDGVKYYKEKILPMVTGYDYLLILNTDVSFSREYCAIFKSCPIVKKGVYKITKDDAGNVQEYKFIKSL